MPDVAICIPVRNERRNLPGLFAALARCDRSDRPLIAISFDGCRDGSLAIAQVEAMRHGLEFCNITLAPWPVADAGRARTAALALGRQQVGGGGLLLTTDADTRPAPDWVSASVSALRGADLVCGRIDRRRRAIDQWRDPIEAYLDRLHTVRRAIDPVAGDAAPTHWHEGGASLGLRASAWDAVSTAPFPPNGEDAAIVLRARLAGLVVRQDPSVRVLTSSRILGRATGGLADALRAGRYAQDHREPDMEHPDDVIDRSRRAAIGRAAYPAVDAEALARRLGIAADAVRDAIAGAKSADAFATALPLTNRPHRAVPLSEAARLLGRHERALALACA